MRDIKKGPYWTSRGGKLQFSKVKKKNTLDGHNNRLDVAEENTNKLESRAIKAIHNIQRTNNKNDSRSLIQSCKKTVNQSL